LGATPEARAAAYREAMAEYLASGDHAPIDEEVEDEDEIVYERRVRRPDGTSAREDGRQYGRKRKVRR
jgi:hypothetical protein